MTVLTQARVNRSVSPDEGVFLQSCPVCGRRLHISLEHDGADVTCFHCQAVFRARNVGQNGATATVGGATSRMAATRQGRSLVPTLG